MGERSTSAVSSAFVRTALTTIALSAGLIAGTAVQSQTPAPTTAAAAAVLKRADVDALLATPDKVLIVDVRRPDEIAGKGGFPVYLDVQLADLERSLPLIPRDRTIITVSNHAARATRAAGLLRAHGFPVAGAIGVEGYAAEGGTLFKPVVPPAAAPAKPNP